MNEIRQAVLASWERASRSVEFTGSVILNQASAAGQYLTIAKGNVEAAIALLPGSCEWWAEVRLTLLRIDREESAVRDTPSKRTG